MAKSAGLAPRRIFPVMAFQLRDFSRHRVLVGEHDLAQLFGIETAAEVGRADEVDEHERQMTALDRRGRAGCRPVGWQEADCIENSRWPTARTPTSLRSQPSGDVGPQGRSRCPGTPTHSTASPGRAAALQCPTPPPSPSTFGPSFVSCQAAGRCAADGRTFWFNRNRFSGSYLAFSAARRA